MNSEKSCKHEIAAGHCGLCAPSTNIGNREKRALARRLSEAMPREVWLSRTGVAIHSRVTCEALKEGLRKASRAGKFVESPYRSSSYKALLDKGRPCAWCLLPKLSLQVEDQPELRTFLKKLMGSKRTRRPRPPHEREGRNAFTRNRKSGTRLPRVGL